MKKVKFKNTPTVYRYSKKLNYKELSEKIDNLNWLIKFDYSIKIKTINDVFNNLHYSELVKTSYVYSYRSLNLTSTYKVEKNGPGILKQDLGNSRSIEDIYLICKYYFPEVTLEEIANLVVKKFYFMGYCTTHRKFMFNVYANNGSCSYLPENTKIQLIKSFKIES